MNRIYALRTLTPLHVGTGQSVGTTDLPIARERATRWPVVPGSSVKGVLKDAAKVAHLNGAGRTAGAGEKAEKEVAYLFGEEDPRNAKAGILSVSDARCLLFPVRSFAGTFAYVTCPLALSRLNPLLTAAGLQNIVVPAVEELKALVCKNSVIQRNVQVILEEVDLAALPGADAAAATLEAALGDDISARFAIVHDDVFTYLTETSTEVVTHVSLKFETKTARDGFLRSEERVPSEAVFLGFARLDLALHPDKEQRATGYLDGLQGKLLQFGGKSSVGNGLCTFSWWTAQ